jgi:very-short-patch-repair endonuclease
MIERLLKSLEVDFVSTSWDGMKLVVNYDGNDHSSDADRNDLIEYIPELDYRLLEDELDSDNSNLDYGYLDSIYE